ncbi:MAG: FtsW/RodA/SpoVE family cell cycle protein [Clostridia bacterium]|nr:FtsW/RodA/SpoVE family cell cycle protein [Clostridia bacterium]
MKHIIVEFSKYVILILIAMYTLECFYVFRISSEKKRNGIYFRQHIFMVLIHFISFLVLCFETQDVSYIFLYLLQQITIFVTLVCYRRFYPKANRLIVNNMCFLLTISFVILTRLSYAKSIKQFKIVLLSLIVSFAIPFLMTKLKLLRNFYYIFAAAGLIMLLIVATLGRTTNGSKLFYSFFGYSFQPSELVKIIFVFCIAGLLSKSTEFKQVLITAVIAAAHILILVLSKDLGSALIFFVTYVTMLFIASKNWLYPLIGLVCGCGASVVGYQLFRHVRIRVQAWRDPWSTIENAGYQITQSLFAIGTGGLFGMGVSQGSPKKIPVVESDFIFAAIAEEFGGIFSICLILICVSCYVMFMNIAIKMKVNFYKYIAIGLATIYAFQVFLTIGGVTKFIPLTGVTLPLISYGGSSVFVTLLMFSIIQGLYLLNSNSSAKNTHKEELS